MPLIDIRTRAAAALADALKTEFDHITDEIILEVPPNRDLGDLAWPGALPLAGVFRTAPRAIAETLAEKTRWPDEITRVEIAGPGFLNLFLDRSTVLERLLRADEFKPQSQGKTIVEHTNINPNKAAHIGHLRNAVLGDVLVRCLLHLGHEVEVQNYIDDTGVQVADVVVGVLYLPEIDLAAAMDVEPSRRDDLIGRIIQALPGDTMPTPDSKDFDDLCWEIYPRVTNLYPLDENLAARRAEVLHAVEAGFDTMALDEAEFSLQRSVISGEPFSGRAIARLAAAVADANVRCHLATMARLGVAYDLLPHESDILHLGFWSRAFDLLKQAGAIRLEKEGKNSGCWVMSLADSPEFADMEDPDKILVRSNGTVTYTGKDIAYQLWKLGLLTDPDGSRHDFGYDLFTTWAQDRPASPVSYGAGDHRLGLTTSDAQQTLPGLTFGNGDRVYNVIDVRQSYPQKVVKEAVRILGHPEAADRSIHFAYEMVALTPAAVRIIEEKSGRSFGLDREQMQKAYVEMSGRKGIGVKADEFLDILEARAAEAIKDRAGEAELPEDLDSRAQAIAVGALRYLMARQSRNRVLAFDFDEALSFEGDTGPYLQYSSVRSRKIFDKLQKRRGEGRIEESEIDALAQSEIPNDLWALILECALRRDVVAQAVATLEFSLLAGHVHTLAQIFHKLYHAHPVVPEENENLRRLRRAVFTLFADEMGVLLEELLGIPVPEEM
ncbi:MAG: arginine--tRNA ligase [Thermoanaerobaculales bacterium]|nr:arginine--tRNA ligase [Thermoanaerobaculales bacterium]